MSTLISREIHLRRRPNGLPTPDDFSLERVEISEPAEGELIVRNSFMSVDPYMRGRMVDRRSYVPPFALGEVLNGGAVGEVVQSRNERFSEGDRVLSSQGWREYFLSDGKGLQKVDPDLAPIQSYLGILGMPGMTAYVGLLDIGKPEEGETVFVSAAAGAVGSVVCQIAKIKGCRVIGSAGSDAKIGWLKENAGIDGAINYRQAKNLHKALGEQAPDGLDIYFDNVGADHLEAALSHMRDYGRIIACGAIAVYNATEPTPGPRNLGLMIGRRLRMQGFIVSDHGDRRQSFVEDMSSWMAEGKIVWEETIVDGIESAPDALIGLFTGHNIGKMLVKLN